MVHLLTLEVCHCVLSQMDAAIPTTPEDNFSYAPLVFIIFGV